MEDKDALYCRTQLITYLGNKRKLLPFIDEGVRYVRQRLGGSLLRSYDAFAGSGVVSRYLKGCSSALYSNDLEAYSAVLGRCYLSNRSQVEALQLPELHTNLLETIEGNMAPGFIAEMYAPRDDEHIAAGERAFYTRRNAMYLDTARRAIGELAEHVQPYFLAPLLYEASVHTNTGGVFKGFYKDESGRGQFGGRSRQALERIMADITLPLPVLSQHECQYEVLQGDAAQTALSLPDLDLAYLDPPYNQHPYGSNYFMLNVITEYKKPERISSVSGIPQEWNRSAYNSRVRVAKALQSLLASLPSRYAIMSYNSEGLLTQREIQALARPEWKVKTLEQSYPTYKASRNLNSRSLWVKEYLFILERR